MTQLDMLKEVERYQQNEERTRPEAEEEFKHYKALAIELTKIGHPTTAEIKQNDKGEMHAVINIIDYPYAYIELVDEYRSGSGYWSSRPTGKKRLRAPAINDRARHMDTKDKSWKQKKDGTFSYDKIAEDISSVIERRELRKQKENKHQRNKQLAGKVRGELGFKESSYDFEYGYDKHMYTDLGTLSIGGSEFNEDNVKFEFKISRNMTPEKAKELFEKLQQAGLLEKTS